ncbi:MAG: stress-induced protein [Bdellovibrionaceae bacterium]|nr:stress-induced protein [Bdellovibrio sp.]
MANQNQQTQGTTSTSNRGFASMDKELQRRIASQGGRAAHQQGTAHEFTSEEARLAGKKGGEAVSQNREHMAAIGRKGGAASGGSQAKNSKNQSKSQMQTNDAAPVQEATRPANEESVEGFQEAISKEAKRAQNI